MRIFAYKVLKNSEPRPLIMGRSLTTVTNLAFSWYAASDAPDDLRVKLDVWEFVFETYGSGIAGPGFVCPSSDDLAQIGLPIRGASASSLG